MEVKKLADQIRSAFEDMANDNDDLCGYCKRASVQFFLEAKKRGYNVRMVASIWHVYNIYDGYIIDITATQFGISDKVWVIKANEKSQTEFWKPVSKGSDLESLEDLGVAGWPVSQTEIEQDYKHVEKFIK